MVTNLNVVVLAVSNFPLRRAFPERYEHVITYEWCVCVCVTMVHGLEGRARVGEKRCSGMGVSAANQGRLVENGRVTYNDDG